MLDTNSVLSHPIALVHSDLYANWVFSENHPTQGRRFTIAAQRHSRSWRRSKESVLPELRPTIC